MQTPNTPSRNSESAVTAMTTLSVSSVVSYLPTKSLPVPAPDVKDISWLKSLPRWVGWHITEKSDKPGEFDKQPYSPKTGWFAESDDPSTWVTHAEAREAKDAGKCNAIGLALGKDLGLTVIDFDKVRASKDDPWPEWVLEEIEALDSFTEVSASGRGFHVLCWGSVPSNHNQQKLCVEIWDSEKMFAFTGDVYEGRNKINARQEKLTKLHSRILNKQIGPNHKAVFVVEKYDSQKYQDVINDDWAKYGMDSRSAAVQSALWTLAAKHHFDREAMRKEFESTRLHDAWEDAHPGKWARLYETEIDKAIACVQKWEEANKQKRPNSRELNFRFPSVPAKVLDFSLLPKKTFDGWFPRGRTSIIAGSSGAGKTTLFVDLLKTQRERGTFLGHVGAGLPFLMVCADRGALSNQETLMRMGIEPGTFPIEYIPVCWGHEAIQAILEKIEEQPTLPAVVFVEGGDTLIEDAAKTQVVAPFVNVLTKVAEHYHIAIILSLGAPKSKAGEQHTLKRDRIFGSQIWGRLTETVALMSHDGDGSNGVRELQIEHRNAATEKFKLQFLSNGRLAEVVVSPDLDTFSLWASSLAVTKPESLGWFNRKEAVAAMASCESGMKKSTVHNRINGLLADKRLETEWRDGKDGKDSGAYLRWKSEAEGAQGVSL
jgi:hypothetical protein